MTLVAVDEGQELERHLPKPPNIHRIVMLHSSHDLWRKLDARNIEALPDLVGVPREAHGEVKAGYLEPELLLFFLCCIIDPCLRVTFFD